MHEEDLAPKFAIGSQNSWTNRGHGLSINFLRYFTKTPNTMIFLTLLGFYLGNAYATFTLCLAFVVFLLKNDPTNRCLSWCYQRTLRYNMCFLLTSHIEQQQTKKKRPENSALKKLFQPLTWCWEPGIGIFWMMRMAAVAGYNLKTVNILICFSL